jgi:hypothetical protein
MHGKKIVTYYYEIGNRPFQALLIGINTKLHVHTHFKLWLILFTAIDSCGKLKQVHM